MRPKVVCLHLLATLMFTRTVCAAPMPLPVEGGPSQGAAPVPAPAAADDLSAPVGTLYILDAKGHKTKGVDEATKKATAAARKRALRFINQIANTKDAKKMFGGDLTVPEVFGSVLANTNPRGLIYLLLEIKGPNQGEYAGWTGYSTARSTPTVGKLYYCDGPQFGALRDGELKKNSGEHDTEFLHNVKLEQVLKTVPEALRATAGLPKHPLSEPSSPDRKAKLQNVSMAHTHTCFYTATVLLYLRFVILLQRVSPP
ncbi:hypothetical protein BDP27DRAFT_1317828 [Rhodocollybia butyracea]|uniref:Uncharacterized protein n=1 Tax=Rhodocollybia butyracea TaxID=206335 RepID=A0A9P5Q5L7_9AGAR|nr:hypothetical protein BDP27DRAFT_1317828 [Rhodocollybia butyracea]